MSWHSSMNIKQGFGNERPATERDCVVDCQNQWAHRKMHEPPEMNGFSSMQHAYRRAATLLIFAISIQVSQRHSLLNKPRIQLWFSYLWAIQSNDFQRIPPEAVSCTCIHLADASKASASNIGVALHPRLSESVLQQQFHAQASTCSHWLLLLLLMGVFHRSFSSQVSVREQSIVPCFWPTSTGVLHTLEFSSWSSWSRW